MRHYYFLNLTWTTSLLIISDCQIYRKLLSDDKNKNSKSEFSNSLVINYPLHLFSNEADNNYEWRSEAKYDQNFRITHEKSRTWLKMANAQDSEDAWLYENWFYGMTNGVIMESGALNGVTFSTSHMFETFANWTAIHIEADPENYKELVKNRINAINVNCALCSEPKLLHYSSGSVIPTRGFIELMSPSFIKKWHKKVYYNITKIEDLPTVQCVKITSVLRQLNIKHVDVWILDVEGAEESVLKGTDFNKIHFNAVAMECDQHDYEKNQRKMAILENNNFKCYTIERNCMCRHKEFKPSAIKRKSAYKIYRSKETYTGEIVESNTFHNTATTTSRSDIDNTHKDMNKNNLNKNSQNKKLENSIEFLNNNIEVSEKLKQTDEAPSDNKIHNNKLRRSSNNKATKSHSKDNNNNNNNLIEFIDMPVK